MNADRNRIILITGGARSGKSSFALEKASDVCAAKAFIATAEGLDREMCERIAAHRKQRGNEWRTFEEPLRVAELLKKIGGEYEVIVLDCLTLWLSNIMTRAQCRDNRNHTSEVRTLKSGRRTKSFEMEIERLLDSLGHFRGLPTCRTCSGFSTLLLISNEIGMGIVPDNELSRRFRDLAGLLNRRLAEIADEVYFMVSGIALKIKGEGK